MEFLILKLQICWQLIAMMLQVEVVLTQTCLQSNGGDVPFDDLAQQAGRLPSGSQAIVASYQFQCCGRVTRWQTRMQPGGENHENGVYSIRFQVWRPGPAVDSDGCYSLVGEDVYDDVILTNPGRLADRTVDSSNVISVQPGDVVGYYVVSDNGGDEGIQLDGVGEESVWYTNEMPPAGGNCPFPVGEGRTLSFSTNAAPVISVGMVSTSCPRPFTITVMDSTVQPFTTNSTVAHLVPNLVTTPTLTPTPQALESPLPSVAMTTTHLVSTPTTTPTPTQASESLLRPVAITTAYLLSTFMTTPTATLTSQVSESPPDDLNKEASGLNERDIAIAAGVSALTTLVVLIGIISAAVLIFMEKRRAKKIFNGGRDTLELNVNVAHNDTTPTNERYAISSINTTMTINHATNITTSANERYVASTVMALNPAYNCINATSLDYSDSAEDHHYTSIPNKSHHEDYDYVRNL